MAPTPATPSAGRGFERRLSVLAALRAALGPCLGRLIALSVFINALSLAAPIFVLQVYDRVVPHGAIETLKAFLIAIVAVILFDFILKQARSRLVQMIALRIDVAIAGRLYSRLTGLPLAALDRKTSAEWRALMRDGDAVRDAVAGPTVLLLVDLPFLLLFLAGVALVAPPLAWLLAAMTPLFILLAAISSWIIGRAAARERGGAVEKTRLIEETVAGRAEVAALGLGPYLRARWARAQVEDIDCAVRRGALVDGFSHLSGALGLLTTVLLTTVGAIAIMDQAMTIGGLIAANMLAARIIQPLGQLVGLARGIERVAGSVARLDAVLTAAEIRFAADVARPRPQGRLRFEKVGFRYAPQAPLALERVTVAFEPGGVTGILGANGSGKSTLLKLAQGLYAPEEGRVLLDDADLAQFGRAELTRWVGYVPQEAFLFAGTVRENLARGRPDVADAAILRAAELAGAAALIDQTPEGYATRIGEGGRPLSPGERQRLALARALVEDPPILILDEPSAHLDFAAEADLRSRLRELSLDRTILLVSHSRALLESCDRLVVMHGGRIAMSGRADDVLPRAERSAPAATPAAPAAPAAQEAAR